MEYRVDYKQLNLSQLLYQMFQIGTSNTVPTLVLTKYTTQEKLVLSVAKTEI